MSYTWWVGPISESSPGTSLKCLFFEKLLFLIWIKKFRNSFWFGRIQPTSATLDYINALCHTKVSIYWKEKPFSKNNLIQFLSFSLNNAKCLILFVWSIFIMYLAHLFFWSLIHNVCEWWYIIYEWWRIYQLL